jgi:glycosyltransferase involved in cell wall biosynthesis
MKKKTYLLSIAVPAYNELKSFPLLIEKYKEAKKDTNFQLVIVDNGSNDGTWEYLSKIKLKKENDFIKIVKIDRNIGYGNGIHEGLKQCEGEVIGWSHADLQYSPNDVFKGYGLYKKINNKLAFIKGHRIKRDKKALILTYGLAIYSTILLFKIFDDINGQPKLFNRELLSNFHNPPKGFSYDLYAQYIAKKNSYKVYHFEVLIEKRIFGISKWAYSAISKFSTIKSFFIDVTKMRFGIIR